MKLLKTPTTIDGIPVYYDQNLTRYTCQVRGLWSFRKIVFGPELFAFPFMEQSALLEHEAAHCTLRHLEKRIAHLWMLFTSPRALSELCIEQEFEADRRTAMRGYGEALASALARHPRPAWPLHPSSAERIARLRSP